MTINVSNLGGAGGLLKIAEAGLGSTILNGNTADVTITCPANKFIKLTLLDSQGASQRISLSVGGRTIFTDKQIANTTVTPPNVKIGLAGGTAEGANIIDGIQGGRSENFVFSFPIATTANILYSYIILEDA